MALERFLLEVPPQSFTFDGTVLGRIGLASPWLFKTGQTVVVSSGAQPAILLQINRIEEDAVYVGLPDSGVKDRIDVSSYLVVDSAVISAPEQRKPFVVDDQNYVVDDLEHEEEPTNAKRVILVDLMGRPMDSAEVNGQRALVVTSGATASPLTEEVIDFSSTGDNIVIPGTGGNVIRVYRLFFVVSASTNITIKDGAGTDLTGVMSMTANGAVVLDFTVENQAWFTTGVGNDFIINQSGTAQVSGRIYYTAAP